MEFERGFVFDSYANRRGKGTHRAVARYERFRNRFRHVLRCDLYRYFPAIDHAVLKADVRRHIRCERTLRLIDGSNPQEPVHLYYPSDDLFTPFERRRGLRRKRAPGRPGPVMTSAPRLGESVRGRAAPALGLQRPAGAAVFPEPIGHTVARPARARSRSRS